MRFNFIFCCIALELLALETDLPHWELLDILIEDVEGLDPISADVEGCEVVASNTEAGEVNVWFANSAELSAA